MFKLNTVFFVLCLFQLSPCPTLASQKDHELKFEGSQRTFVVYSPSSLAKEKLPLMIVIHGGTGNAHHSARTMGMNDVAEKNNFIVAYPDGTGTALGADRRVWNAGNCCAIAQRKNINDVKFIKEMIENIEKNYPIDENRIYVTGESNGAMLTYRLVCELPDVFAAAVPVSGTLMLDSCKAGQKIALLDVHGTDDQNVPYQGGKGKGLSRATYRSIPESIQIITGLRKCQPPIQKTLANGDVEANYTCEQGAPIRTYLIKGGAHAWPLSSGPGKNSTFSAPDEIWKFVQKFSKSSK